MEPLKTPFSMKHPSSIVAVMLSMLLMTNCTKAQVEVISGVFKELLPLPTIYETFVPILLEYKLPKYSYDNFSIVSWLHENCTSATYKANSICPTAFYLPTEINNFLSFLEEMNPRNEDVSNEVFERNENLNDFLMNWNNLEDSAKNFKNIRTVSNDLAEEYMTNTIKNPALTVYYMSRNIEYFSEDNRITNILNMVNGFRTAFWENINSDRIDEALLSNAVSLYQNMIFQRYLMESSRWTQAESECRHQNLIPKTIVSRGKVANALSNLSMQLHDYSYSLSISPNQLQRYFSEKLTTCVFTQDSFIVTIRVPVYRLEESQQSQKDKLRFFKIQSVPMIASTSDSDKSSNINVCQIEIQNHEHYIQDLTTGMIQISTCKSNQLCPMQPSGFSDFIISDPCISSILETKEQDFNDAILQNCPLACKNVEQSNVKEFPWIKFISNQTFVLTGKSDGNHGRSAILRCPGEDKIIPTFDVGAVLINVPYKCKIVLKENFEATDESEENFDSSFSYSQLHQIVPIHWTGHERLGQFSKEDLNLSFNFQNRSDVSEDDVTALIKSDNCANECSPMGNGSILILIVMFGLVACLMTGFIYLFIQVKKIKTELSYGSDHYKEFVAYKNGTVRCNLLETF